MSRPSLLPSLPSLLALVPLCALGCGPKPAPETAPTPAASTPVPTAAMADAGVVDAASPTAVGSSAPSAAPPEATPVRAGSTKVTLKHDPAYAACHAAYKGGSKDLVAEAGKSGKLCESVTKMKPILTPQKGTQSDHNPPQTVKFEGKAGKCYRVYAMADAGIKDLDLLLKDSTGAIAAEDSTDDSSPVLLEDGAFCFNENDNATLVLSVGEGKGNWALQIWSD